MCISIVPIFQCFLDCYNKPILFQEEDGKDNSEMDEEIPEAEERMEHETQGQTGQENLQSDSAVELAGEASERDQSKEVKYMKVS